MDWERANRPVRPYSLPPWKQKAHKGYIGLWASFIRIPKEPNANHPKTDTSTRTSDRRDAVNRTYTE